MVIPVLWSCAKTLGRETLRTGGDILTDIARSTDKHLRNIVSCRVKETAVNLIGNLQGRCRKLTAVVVKRRQKGGKKPRLTKRDIFSQVTLV